MTPELFDINKARSRYLHTVHTITKDVINPCAPLVDKRLRRTFLQIPIIEAGWRVRVSRDFTFNHDRWSDKIKKLKAEYAVVTLRLLSPRRTAGDDFTWREYRQLGEETAEVEIITKTDRQDTTPMERRRNEAREVFGKALIAALSQPIEDFDSTFEIDRSPDHEEVLRHMWLNGIVTMEQIRAYRAEINKRWQEEEDEKERAEKAEKENANG